VVYDYIDDCKDDIFNGGARIIVERLSDVAKRIGDGLTKALEKLADDVGGFFVICRLLMCIIVDFDYRLNYLSGLFGRETMAVTREPRREPRSWNQFRILLSRLSFCRRRVSKRKTNLDPLTLSVNVFGGNSSFSRYRPALTRFLLLPLFCAKAVECSQLECTG
jgi:hypothetical protein